MIDRPPRDVVPPRPLTREDVLRARALAGQAVTVIDPGEPVYDADGALVGMTASTTSTATFVGLRISDALAASLGLPPDSHDDPDPADDGDHDHD